MSEQNVQFVQSLYAAFGAGDVKAIIKGSSAEVIWEIVGRASDFPAFGRRTGLEGVAEFFQAFYENEQIEGFTPQAFHVSGDKVIVEGHAASLLKGSDRRVDSDWLHIFTMKDGKLIAFKEFYDTAQYVG